MGTSSTSFMVLQVQYSAPQEQVERPLTGEGLYCHLNAAAWLDQPVGLHTARLHAAGLLLCRWHDWHLGMSDDVGPWTSSPEHSVLSDVTCRAGQDCLP